MLSGCSLVFELVGRQVPKREMAASAVVKDSDELEDGLPVGHTILAAGVLEQPPFQGAGKAFHDGIVPAISLATHAAPSPHAGQLFSKYPAGVVGGFKWSL